MEQAPLRVVPRMVRELRQKAGLSLRELSKATGISAAYIAKIENGKASPREPMVSRLARGLGVDTEEIAPYGLDAEAPASLPDRGVVRANMRYVVEFDSSRSDGPRGRGRYIGMRVIYSYDLFNPADQPHPYEVVSEIEDEAGPLGPAESRIARVALEWDDSDRAVEVLGEADLNPVREGIVKRVRLDRSIPSRGRLSVQVECFTREMLDFHRPWWVTYPTERMYVVVRYPSWLHVSVEKHPDTLARFRKVLDAPGIAWYEIGGRVEANQGVDIYWSEVQTRAIDRSGDRPAMPRAGGRAHK